MGMLGWFRALLPREDRFFDLFEKHSRAVVAGAGRCRSCWPAAPISNPLPRIVDLEHQADDITREVLVAVHRSFITPFDRGDIKDLIQSMDDAIDMMRKTVKTVILFEQKSFDPKMQEMGALIVEAARLNAEAIPLLNKVGTHAARLRRLPRK